jgi:hypothetical protein
MGLKRPAQIDGSQLFRGAQGEGSRYGLPSLIGWRTSLQLGQRGPVLGASNNTIESAP